MTSSDLPNAYVVVVYDYDYTNDQGEVVSMRENELYRLVDKSNEEWWEVLNLASKTVDESFFVPYNYVKEISENEMKSRLTKLEKEREKEDKEKDKDKKKKDKEKEVEKDKKAKKEKEKEKEKSDKKAKDKPKPKEPEKSIIKPADKPTEPAKARPPDDEADSSKVQDTRSGSLKRGVPNIYPNLNLNNELTKRFSASVKLGSGVQMQDIDIDSPNVSSSHPASAAAVSNADDDSETESGPESTSTAGAQTTEPVAETDLQPVYENLAKLRALAAEKERQRRSARTNISGRASADNLSRERLGSTRKPDAADKSADRSSEKEKASGNSRRLEISEPMELRAIEKRGTLLKARIFERGKRVPKKKWQDAYVILSGALLMFYRDAKAASARPGAPFGNPEAILELKYASFEFPASRELTSRKAALLLAFRTALPNSQIRFGYLLACSDELKMREWSSALQMAHTLLVENRLPKAMAVEHNPVITAPIESIQLSAPASGAQPLRAASQKRPADSPALSKTRAAPGDKGSDAPPPQMDDAERKRIKDRLKHFFTRRPGMESLQSRSIFRDDLLTFGSRIDLICKREQRSVPSFVERCVAYVEQRGLDVDGIYRLSGNQAHIQKLRCQIEQYDNYDLDGWDVHVVTGALKLFFRELKEPLVPIAIGNSFRDAASNPDQGGVNSRRKRFKELLLTMQKESPSNLATLKAMLVHLRHVVEHASQNRMQLSNLAIIFGPSMFGSAATAPGANSLSSAASGAQADAKDVSIMIWQAEIVQIFLEEFTTLFGPS